MIEKTGRPRHLIFRNELGVKDPGAQWMVGMFFELGDRVLDQVEHIPERILHSSPRDSYLSPARVLLHLIGSDVRRVPSIVGPGPQPPYSAVVARTQSENFPTMETQGVDVIGVLRSHLEYRKAHWAQPLARPGILDETIDDANFATKRDALGHLIWHWSFHSGHLGAVTLEQGYEYNWTSVSRAQ